MEAPEDDDSQNRQYGKVSGSGLPPLPKLTPTATAAPRCPNSSPPPSPRTHVARGLSKDSIKLNARGSSNTRLPRRSVSARKTRRFGQADYTWSKEFHDAIPAKFASEKSASEKVDSQEKSCSFPDQARTFRVPRMMKYTDQDEEFMAYFYGKLRKLVNPRLAKRIELNKEPIAAGATAKAYLGNLKGKGQVVVKKMIIMGSGGLYRMLNEIRALSMFDHPSVIKYYGCYLEEDKRDGTVLCLVTEFANGGEFYKAWFKNGNGTIMAPKDIASVAKQFLEALAYVHSFGLIHRDIKPENLFLHNGKIILADFGEALHRKNDGYCLKATGTTEYQAPEIAHGQKYTEKADIYSAGILLYQLATYTFVPMEWKEAKSSDIYLLKMDPAVLTSMDEYLVDFLMSCLEMNPRLRPSAEQLLNHEFIKKYTEVENENPRRKVGRGHSTLEMVGHEDEGERQIKIVPILEFIETETRPETEERKSPRREGCKEKKAKESDKGKDTEEHARIVEERRRAKRREKGKEKEKGRKK